MGYDGKIIFDEKYPDGTPRKLLDSTTINSLGWKPHIDLESGLKMTYKYYLKEMLTN